MLTQETYKIEKTPDQVVVVFSTTHVNPISYLPTIEEDLGKMDYSGKIFFDLLLSNGYSFNRFVEAVACIGKVDRKSMKVVGCTDLDETTLAHTQGFYKSNPFLVKANLILSDEEKCQFMGECGMRGVRFPVLVRHR